MLVVSGAGVKDDLTVKVCQGPSPIARKCVSPFLAVIPASTMFKAITFWGFLCVALSVVEIAAQVSDPVAATPEAAQQNASVIKLAPGDLVQDEQETEPVLEGFSLNDDGFYAVEQGQISSASNFFEDGNPGKGIGSDFFGLNDNFDEGLIISNGNVAMKLGGFVKVDAIYDFNPIASTDSFDTATIEVNAAPRRNSRIHARQTRFNADTRWETPRGPARIFVEGDFFFNQSKNFELGSNRFRLRHAYMQRGKWLAGQTWTTLSDVAASPATIDFEGQVASITTRRAQIRWTQKNLFKTRWALSLAVENPFTLIEVPESVDGQPRTPSPDGVFRLRYEGELVQAQMAGVVRELGFQLKDEPVVTGNAWGVNFTQVAKMSPRNKFYSALLWGSGIGSFRGIPDYAVNDTGDDGMILDSLGWMLGTTHEWNDDFSSNLIYAENGIINTSGIRPDALKRVTYFAGNLIYTPAERISIGVEYLYGTRQDFDGHKGKANRVQFAVTYYLP